jgi:hypothetical protein
MSHRPAVSAQRRWRVPSAKSPERCLSFSLRRVARHFTERKALKITRDLLSRNIFVNPDIGRLELAAQADAFVFSMPKCATSAIQRGFDNAGRPALHAHNNPTFYDAFSNGAILRQAGVGLEQIIRLRRLDNARPLFIFFGYREPVSWYFSLAGHFQLELNAGLRGDIISNLASGYPWARYKIGETLALIEAATGIDIWRRPFDRVAGYSRYSKGNVHLIVYRYDRLRELEHMIVDEIEPRFVMRRERVNTNSAYLQYVRDLRLDEAVLDKVMSGKFFDYFYAPAERRQLMGRYLPPPRELPAEQGPDFR